MSLMSSDTLQAFRDGESRLERISQMTTYLFRVHPASVADFRAAMIADELIDPTPDSYETDDRAHGERIAKRHGISVAIEIGYDYATDSETGTLYAADFDAACDQLEAMVGGADGGSGWVEDVDGYRYTVGR